MRLRTRIPLNGVVEIVKEIYWFLGSYKKVLHNDTSHFIIDMNTYAACLRRKGTADHENV